MYSIDSESRKNSEQLVLITSHYALVFCLRRLQVRQSCALLQLKISSEHPPLNFALSLSCLTFLACQASKTV